MCYNLKQRSRFVMYNICTLKTPLFVILVLHTQNTFICDFSFEEGVAYIQ